MSHSRHDLSLGKFRPMEAGFQWLSTLPTEVKQAECIFVPALMEDSVPIHQ